MLAYRKYIRGVVDSQNGIPFFSPLVVRRRTPVLMLLHHVHTDQFGLYFPPLVARAGAWLERTGLGAGLPGPDHRGGVALQPEGRPAPPGTEG